MNVGYASPENAFKHNVSCPICNSDVYGSKYGNRFVCMNKDCVLHDTDSSEFINNIREVESKL